MNKIILILIPALLLLSGCEFLDKTICFEHNEIDIEQTGQRTWTIEKGEFILHMYLCDKEINTTEVDRKRWNYD